MTPLDAEARRLVAAAGKRVSVVTAVSPRAAVDMIFVLVNALALIRRLAVLYGGRPGTLGRAQAAPPGGVASRRDRRRRDDRQRGPAGDRPRRRRAALGQAGRGRAQRPPDRPARAAGHRPDPAAAVLGTAAAGAQRPRGRPAAAVRARSRGEQAPDGSASGKAADSPVFLAFGQARRYMHAHLTRGHWPSRPSGGPEPCQVSGSQVRGGTTGE